MAVPATPTGLTAESAESGTLVTWNPATGAIGYHVQRRLAPGGVGTGTFITFANAVGVASLLDTHAVDTIEFEYRVIAYNNDGLSDPSNADWAPGQVTGASDGFDPSLTSATVNSAGDTLTLVFSEWVYGVFAGEYALSGGHALSGAAGPAGATWTMGIAPRAELGETLTLAYTGTSTLDSDAAPMDAFADFAVVNGSTQTGATSPTTYGTRAGIEGIYGTADVAAYADVNDNQDASDIAGQIDRARQHAYDWINSHLRGAGLTAPATADNFSEFGLLDDIENERAGAWLYFKRGKNDNDPTGPAQMQWHWDNAGAELERVIDAARRSIEGVAGASAIAVATPNVSLPRFV